MGPQDRRISQRALSINRAGLDTAGVHVLPLICHRGGSQMGTTCHGCLAELSQRRRRRPVWLQDSDQHPGEFRALPVKACMLMGGGGVPARAGWLGPPGEPGFTVAVAPRVAPCRTGWCPSPASSLLGFGAPLCFYTAQFPPKPASSWLQMLHKCFPNTLVFG